MAGGRGRHLGMSLIVALLASLLPVIATTSASEQASAATPRASDFDPGYIISDALFYDGAAMTTLEIQRFLDQQIGQCQGTLCLNIFRQATQDKPASERCPGGYRGVPSESAAEIIFKVQSSCRISAKVILVTLQKEQSLVTHRNPSAARIERSMGYYCPDDTTRPGWCDPRYGGFFNQVYNASAQFQRYRLQPESFGHRVRTQEVRLHPNTACGSQTVTIRNSATAGLYNYTPYVPNAAAMNNLYGVGDGCSAYGNRNFWRMYTEWFGSTTGAIHPTGNVESVSTTADGFQVTGWAADPDSPDPIDVHIYVNGVGYAATASGSRPDVQANIPGAGPRHGFSATVPYRNGANAVCVYALNVGPGNNALLNCRTVSVTAPGELGRAPIGAFDQARVDGNTVTVSGWAIDPDTRAAIDVHLYVGGAGSVLRANGSRPDVARAYPAYTSTHGFSAQIGAPAGTSTVCAYGIDSRGGTNTLLGCRTIRVESPTVSGAFDTATATSGGVAVTGWMFEQGVATPGEVHVYVGSAGYALTASQSRPDVGRVYPAAGSSRGFAETLPAPAGQHAVCAYGIATRGGANQLLGCRVVNVP